MNQRYTQEWCVEHKRHERIPACDTGDTYLDDEYERYASAKEDDQISRPRG